MIAWFVRNSVAANLLMLSILALGIFSLYVKIPLEIFPELAPEKIAIKMNLRGATPEEIEKSLTIRIEEAIQSLPGIKRIVSQSLEGKSSISVEVQPNYEPRDLLSDIKSRIDTINTFPLEAEKPNISLIFRKRDVMAVILASPYGEKETSHYAKFIRDHLLKFKGVSQIILNGVRNYELVIEISQDKLLEYHLSIKEVSEMIKKSSIDLSSGTLKTKGGELLIRSAGQAYSKSDFMAIPIRSHIDGSILKLGDIAKITDGFEESSLRTRFNGKNSIKNE